ncbi:hypothetical protein [Nitrospira japonica]|nr:hypothetical protein [Nitrospira japonica]
MIESIAQIYAQVQPDSWRQRQDFSAEIREAQAMLFDEASKGRKDAIAKILGKWLERYQPCLFGRVAARLDLIEYCVLLEEDLYKSDEEVLSLIQDARTRWTRDGFYGRKNAFIIFAVSPRLSSALPDATMMRLARRLAFLYLRQEVEPDQIYFDELYLEIPGNSKTTWKWPTGINYFAAHGDGRWWHDHRIPGGIAFSINSIGHMVKSGRLAKGMNDLLELVDSAEEGWNPSLVDSLDKALDLSMRTINGASDTVSGRATFLLPITEEERQRLPTCPIQLPKLLAGNNHCEYAGFYHTDYTIPSEYFLPDVERPIGTTKHILDFTYLFRGDVNNPDYDQLGSGTRIRGGIDMATQASSVRANKGTPIAVDVADVPRLVAALGNEGQMS